MRLRRARLREKAPDQKTRWVSAALSLCLLAAAAFVWAQGAAENVPHSSSAPQAAATRPDELLTFKVEWNPPWYLFFLPAMEAGEVELSHHAASEFEGKKAALTEFRARSSGTLARLTGMKVDDLYQFFSHPETLCTFFARKREREGKRLRDIEVRYLPESRRLHIRELDMAFSPPQVKKDRHTEGIPECVHDICSALYHTRRRELAVGTRFRSLLGDNERIREVEVLVDRKDRLLVPAGTYEAWRLQTVALVGGLFKEGGEFHIWLSADARKIPVQFQVKVRLGTVTGRLTAAR